MTLIRSNRPDGDTDLGANELGWFTSVKVKGFQPSAPRNLEQLSEPDRHSPCESVLPAPNAYRHPIAQSQSSERAGEIFVSQWSTNGRRIDGTPVCRVLFQITATAQQRGCQLYSGEHGLRPTRVATGSDTPSTSWFVKHVSPPTYEEGMTEGLLSQKDTQEEGRGCLRS